jgi:hypothetical protein
LKKKLLMKMKHVQLRTQIAAIIVMALLGACSKSDKVFVAGPQGNAKAPLAHVDWEAVIDDLDCSGINRGIEVGGVRYADVTGDGAEEAFVWVDCVHPTSGWPDVLEVFDGSSDPKAPKRIGVLIGEKENLHVKSLTFSGHTVTVDAAAFAKQDPNCCASLRIRQSFTWEGGSFRAGKRAVRTVRQGE